MLLREIKEKENQLYSKASNKEKLFYCFLLKKEANFNINEFGEIDKICYAAFKNIRNEELDRIIERNKKSQPVAGSHYSSNLISICAFSLYDEQIKNNQLNHFFSKNGLKEQFIIHNIFENELNVNAVNTENSIDILINDILIQGNTIDSSKKIIAALEKCNDLSDLYIIRLSFLYCNEKNPGILVKNELLNFHNSIVRYINYILNYLVGIIIIGLIPTIYYVIVRYWSAWDLEPHLAAIGIVSPLIAILAYLLFKFRKTWEELLESIKLIVVKKVYKFLNMDYDKIYPVITEKNE